MEKTANNNQPTNNNQSANSNHSNNNRSMNNNRPNNNNRQGNNRGFGQEVPEFDERIIALDRVTRVVKGGRRFRFRATAVVGDGKGKVGIGVGKGTDAPTSIIKAVARAKKDMITFSLNGTTIPHEIQVTFGGAVVFLKPARPGTGVIAGGAVRAVLEAAGVKDVLTKALGSSNKINNSYATVEALSKLKADKVVASEEAK